MITKENIDSIFHSCEFERCEGDCDGDIAFMKMKSIAEKLFEELEIKKEIIIKEIERRLEIETKYMDKINGQ